MKFVVRAAVALSLLLGVYVLAAGIVLALAVAVYEGISHGLNGLLLGKGAGLLLIVTLALARGFWAVHRVPRDEPTGYSLSPEDEPALWQEVRSIAETVGTRPPDDIVLVSRVNASVWEDTRFLGLLAGRRVMTVGAPLVLGLTRQQLRAVFAHELGHYSHRHTALAPVVYRGGLTLSHLVASLGEETRTGKVFAAYRRLYLRLTRSITRRQEVEADEWSHRVAGRDASAQAMRELDALDAIWGYFLEHYAFRVDGVRPDRLFAGFENLLGSTKRQGELDELRTRTRTEEQSPYDTHPSLQSRIDYFESLPADGIADDGAPGAGLIGDAQRACDQLESVMFAAAELEARPWTWIAETAGLQQARQNASMLVRATSHPRSGAATLHEAIRAIARNDAQRLVKPFITPDMPADQVDAAARGLVQDAVAAALVEHCGARFTLDWDSNDALVDPAGLPIDTAGLVADVVDTYTAEGLIGALEDEGVPSSFAVDPHQLDAEAARDHEPAVQSIATCISWRRMRVLVVADNALIIKRLGLVEAFTSTLRHGRLDPSLTVMHFVASIPLPQLLKDHRAAAFPWDQVGRARLSGNLLSLSLNGKTRVLRVRPSAVAGDLVGSLRHHLGDRVALA